MTKFVRVTDDQIINVDEVYSVHKCDSGVQFNFKRGSYEVVENGTMDEVYETLKDVFDRA